METPYGRSKQEGERLVLALGPARGRDPPLARVRAGRLVRGGAGRPPAPAGALRGDRQRREPVGRRARRRRRSALRARGASARAPGSIYHVVDDEPITFYDFMALTAEALGARAAAARSGGARARGRRAATRSRRSCARRARRTRRSSASSAGSRAFRPRAAGVADAVRAARAAPALAAPAAERALGLVGDVAGDRQRGGRRRRGRVAHVQRALGGGEDEVVDAAGRRGRAPARARRRTPARTSADSQLGHVACGGARRRPSAARRGAARSRRCATSGRASARCRARRACRAGLARAPCAGGRRRARRAISAVGPISTSPSMCLVRCTPRNGSDGSGTG